MFLLKKLKKIALNWNDDKIIQSIVPIETDIHGKIKDLVCKKKKTKRNNVIKQHKIVWLSLYYKRRPKKSLSKLARNFWPSI